MKNWWKESIVYQVYPRSFKDSSGNGVGDIDGIIEKLDHIASLGVDLIWICPIYRSPNADNGYDISDYRKINDEFGGNTAFERLLKAVHNRDMKLMMDLVANHSSDEHYWFQEAKKSKDNPYHDYYHWKEGLPDTPPNNWESVFNGSVWEWNEKTQEYYLHLFTQKQPDLNWENPTVRKEIYDIITFWLNKGVDGFRMDVISLISKRMEFTSVPETLPFIDVMEQYYSNGPRVHDFIKEMNKQVLSRYDIVTVGEGPGVNLTHGPKYVSAAEKELNMIFHFDHMTLDFGPEGKYDPIPIDWIYFKKIFSQWDKATANDGWNSIFLGNHDFSRIVSRFGNDNTYHDASAKLFATLLMTLRGTPYIYQGDEIGMTNIQHPSIEAYDDIETRNAWDAAEKEGKDMTQFLKAVHRQSRDNARTPMQWKATTYAGFSNSKPWIPVNPNHTEVNVDNQEKDPNSILNYYRKIIAFRKANTTLIYGSYQDLAPDHPHLYIYLREDEKTRFMVVHNLSDSTINWAPQDSKYKMVMGNYEKTQEGLLHPWESQVYRLDIA
ncbi:MAG: Oligo-1,6-glucosidase [Flavobacteriaceae bacterium]|nr:MAG: Oligo-1,6-glucosidase [Flavobacteriaceae bacterium]|tara:strand:+ start:903 stop:2555 length:1653 start_codon:yes stop_codon:yes gene_type:complete